MTTTMTHFGVKGMHWGHRKAKEPSTNNNHEKLKKAAKIGGLVLGTAALAVGAVYAAKYVKGAGGQKIASRVTSPDAAKKFAEKIVEEPVDVVHFSRVKHRGFYPVTHGGLKDPVAEWTKAAFEGHAESAPFKRYGARSEKIAVSFTDPLNRTDFAGRPIPHEVIIPEHLAKGVNDFNTAYNLVWPLIKDNYHAHYEADEEKHNKR